MATQDSFTCRERGLLSAMSYTALSALPSPSPTPATCNGATRFVLAQLSDLPDYLRLPIRALCQGFDLAGLSQGSRFTRLSPSARSRQWEAWRTSPLPPCRDLIRLVESLAVFYASSTPDERGDSQPVRRG